MKSRIARVLIVVFASLACVATVLYISGRRPVADASADSLTRDGARLTRVFEGIKLDQPVFMTQAPTSASRWYVVEQKGRIVSFPNDPRTKRKSVALDITDRVASGGEMGLLGLAFHPRFADTGFIYVNYTSTKDGDRRTRISRFKRRADGISFDPASESVLLTVRQPYSNHNGGQVSFGPDGYLYIGFGDGGLAGDPGNHGQNTSTLLGGIARIDVDAKPPYGIPPDNPFAQGGGAPELFAWGLRNPWRFSFDRQTGLLYVGDVGQNAWEEIDLVEKGKNYGWNIREGTRCYDPPLHLQPLGKGDCGEKVALEPPIIEISQDNGDRSVTGGYVYRGKRSPKLRGAYIYGDFVSGRIWAYDLKSKRSRLLLDTASLISSFVEASDGEIGLLDYALGAVYHLEVDESDQRQ